MIILNWRDIIAIITSKFWIHIFYIKTIFVLGFLKNSRRFNMPLLLHLFFGVSFDVVPTFGGKTGRRSLFSVRTLAESDRRSDAGNSGHRSAAKLIDDNLHHRRNGGRTNSERQVFLKVLLMLLLKIRFMLQILNVRYITLFQNVVVVVVEKRWALMLQILNVRYGI